MRVRVRERARVVLRVTVREYIRVGFMACVCVRVSWDFSLPGEQPRLDRVRGNGVTSVTSCEVRDRDGDRGVGI